MESQLLYKIGALENAVHNMTENFRDSFEGLRRELIERHADNAKEMASLALRVDMKADKEAHKHLLEENVDLRNRLKAIEDWKTSFIAKTSLISAGLIGIGSLIGPIVMKALGSIFHL